MGKWPEKRRTGKRANEIECPEKGTGKAPDLKSRARYGTDSPGDCPVAQLLVFLEDFAGVSVVAVFTAIIIFQLMLPSPKVRFSQNFLISDERNGHFLTFRLVRVSTYDFRDCELSVQCGMLKRRGTIITSCKEEKLALKNPYKSNLDTWFVRHQIDEDSPLKNRELADIAFLNVTLRFFDTAFQQDVRVLHKYIPATDGVTRAVLMTLKGRTWAG